MVSFQRLASVVKEKGYGMVFLFMQVDALACIHGRKALSAMQVEGT